MHQIRPKMTGTNVVKKLLLLKLFGINAGIIIFLIRRDSIEHRSFSYHNRGFSVAGATKEIAANLADCAAKRNVSELPLASSTIVHAAC